VFPYSLLFNPKNFLNIFLYSETLNFYSSLALLLNLVQNEQRSFEIHTLAVTSKLHMNMLMSYFTSRVAHLVWSQLMHCRRSWQNTNRTPYPSSFDLILEMKNYSPRAERGPGKIPDSSQRCLKIRNNAVMMHSTEKSLSWFAWRKGSDIIKFWVVSRHKRNYFTCY
jgi:hypothetical protein